MKNNLLSINIRNPIEGLACGFFVFLQLKAQQVVIYDDGKEDYDY